VSDAFTIALPPELLEQIIAATASRVLERLAEQNGTNEQAAVSPYMTIPEAAEYLRCSRQRIDDLCSQRRLTRHKDGRRTLIARAEIEQHLGANSQ
jgi:excisionase family DNA binding protein